MSDNPTEEQKRIDDQKFTDGLEKIKLILDIVKGKDNPKTKLNAILSPDKIVTSSNIKPLQSNAIHDRISVAKLYPNLYGDLADESSVTMELALSINGFGLEKAIQFASAIEASEILKSRYSDGIITQSNQRKGIIQKIKDRKGDRQ